MYVYVYIYMYCKISSKMSGDSINTHGVVFSNIVIDKKTHGTKRKNKTDHPLSTIFTQPNDQARWAPDDWTRLQPAEHQAALPRTCVAQNCTVEKINRFH